jgi:nitrite reductase/ring-hydroxylating ferredoxin subunit
MPVLPEVELVAGKAVRGWAGETRVVVGRLPDGGCFATLDLCPHLDLPLAAFGPVPIEGGRIVCPWHRWEFDVRTGRCEYASYYADDEIFFFQLRGADRPEGEAAGRLRRLPTRVRNGMVEVDVRAVGAAAVPSYAPAAAAAEDHATAATTATGNLTNHEE